MRMQRFSQPVVVTSRHELIELSNSHMRLQFETMSDQARELAINSRHLYSQFTVQMQNEASLVSAQQFPRSAVDKVRSGASWTRNQFIFVFGNIIVVIQRMLNFFQGPRTCKKN